MTHINDTKLGPNPSGLCMCGCGGTTPIAGYSTKRFGWVKGTHNRYIKGHNSRLSPVEYVIDESTGCWVWQRHRNRDGYGLSHRSGKFAPAHRTIYEEHKGPIPEGLELDHLCRNRACVNPEHLEPVTRTENQRRSPHRKLNTELVAEMRALRAEGWTLVRLSERFHVSVPVVSKICRYETWV